MVELEEAAESPATFDLTSAALLAELDQFVVETLMVSLGVIAPREPIEDTPVRVTIVATRSSILRPRSLARAANRRRCSSLSLGHLPANRLPS